MNAKFKEIREKIGKDIVVKIRNANNEGWGSLTFEWEFIIGIDKFIYRVADEFRENPLSFQNGRYTIINYSQDQEGRIYPNVHDYIQYIKMYLNKAGTFDFIYVWDEKDEKLIVFWEYDREKEQYRFHRVIAEILSKKEGVDISTFSNITVKS